LFGGPYYETVTHFSQLTAFVYYYIHFYEISQVSGHLHKLQKLWNAKDTAWRRFT